MRILLSKHKSNWQYGMSRFGDTHRFRNVQYKVSESFSQIINAKSNAIHPNNAKVMRCLDILKI